MKHFKSGIPLTAAGVLLGLAVFILVLVALTGRGDITTATLILIAFASFVSGVFVLTFTRESDVEAETAALLGVPGIINLSRLSADLGVQGNATFLPAAGSMPAPVMQFNPVSGYTGVPLQTDNSFIISDEAGGVLTIPAGWYLLRTLEKAHQLRCPQDSPGLAAAMKEVAEDVLEVTSRAEINTEDGRFIITLHDFVLARGCRTAGDESVRCCTMFPCAICSLFACMAVRGTGGTFTLEESSTDRGGKLTLVLLPQG